VDSINGICRQQNVNCKSGGMDGWPAALFALSFTLSSWRAQELFSSIAMISSRRKANRETADGMDMALKITA